MTPGTDSLDVVATRAEAARLVRPPLLILEELRRFLDKNSLGQGGLEWQRIGEGQSNATFEIRRGGDRFVVRRGPRPPLPKSTHDMIREARVLRFAFSQGVPVPQVLAVCDDETVLGVPFYVMTHLDGYVITDSVPHELDSMDHRRAMSKALVDLLALLHSIPVDSDEARALGRPDGYLERQVSRFESLWQRNTRRDLPEVAELGRWLTERTPVTQRASVVHGDFRMGNVMFERNGSTRVRALLDWEMATIGDPLADLGYLVATYADDRSASSVMELTSVTRERGYLNRKELIERYGDRSGLDLEHLRWYQTLALWKSAVFCEAIYTRWLDGERPDDSEFAPALEQGVPDLLRLASAEAAGNG